MRYHVELIQTDPEDSPTPGFGHYAGEIDGFGSSTAALVIGLHLLGKPVPSQHFFPCCDWQQQATAITGVVVHRESDDGCCDDNAPGVSARLRPRC